jgi:hypothetical protein
MALATIIFDEKQVKKNDLLRHYRSNLVQEVNKRNSRKLEQSEH